MSINAGLKPTSRRQQMPHHGNQRISSATLSLTAAWRICRLQCQVRSNRVDSHTRSVPQVQSRHRAQWAPSHRPAPSHRRPTVQSLPAVLASCEVMAPAAAPSSAASGALAGVRWFGSSVQPAALMFCRCSSPGAWSGCCRSGSSTQLAIACMGGLPVTRSLRRHSHTKWAQGPVDPKRPHELMEHWDQR
jgi:hypothetical protein